MQRFEDEVDRTLFDLDKYLDNKWVESDEDFGEDESLDDIEGLDLEDYSDE